MEWKDELIRLYLRISENKAIDNYLAGLRHSNNSCPKFSDQELMTLYLFGIHQKHRRVKDIYRYAQQHLLSWFPTLPSYQAFNNRLNRIAGAFALLSGDIIEQTQQLFTSCNESLIDTMPIVLASHSRTEQARVARSMCGKGYCPSKRLYYHGMKLHLVAFVNPGKLPMPELFWFGSALENDLTAARPFFEYVGNRKIYADKIYADGPLNNRMINQQNCRIITPIRKQKGQAFLDAAEALFSTAVSRVRQPIESFFNWLNEMTQIQNASKVRSENGLLAHIWGRICAALLIMEFRLNP